MVHAFRAPIPGLSYKLLRDTESFCHIFYWKSSIPDKGAGEISFLRAISTADLRISFSNVFLPNTRSSSATRFFNATTSDMETTGSSDATATAPAFQHKFTPSIKLGWSYSMMTCNPWTQNYRVAYFLQPCSIFGWKSNVCGATVWIISTELVLASVSRHCSTSWV